MTIVTQAERGMVDEKHPALVFMGVAGSGKSTFAEYAAKKLGWPFMEGDDLHPASNIQKLREGVPLTDEDRWPWLAAIAAWIDGKENEGKPSLVTCSALKRSYREYLSRGRPFLKFVYLDVSMSAAKDRLSNRSGHFFNPSLVDDQFSILEPPIGESNIIAISATDSTNDQFAQLQRWI